MRSRLLAFGLAVLLLPALACRGDRFAEAPPRRHSVARWIEEEPAGPASAIRIHDETSRFRWSFRTPEDLVPWTPSNTDELYGIEPDGLALRSSTGDPYLVRTVDFDAAEVDILRIHESSLLGAFVEVFWAAEGEAFVPERGMRASMEDPGASPDAPSYSIPVGNHPLWKGKIRHLRIDPVSNPRQVVIRSIEGLGRRLDPRRLAEAEARPWRVELNGDARAALLARPGRRWEREIRVPDGAELRVAYSLTATAGPPVTFRVTARDGSSEPRVLFEEAVQPEREPRWREAKVSLAGLAGSRARLVLETRVSGPFDPLQGFPVWGNPEVVAVGKGGDPRPNVVIVLVDTLRADHTSLYGYPRPTTPRLDAWAARRAVVFENAVAPAPWTLPSHISLFSGLDAMTHGINYGHPAPEALSLLAERLRREGYATAAFTGGAFLTPGYGLAQGFDRFHAHRESAHAGDSTGKDLERGIERARAWIEESATEPFFLFLHTYEIHAPFSAREPYFSRFAGPEGRRPGEAPPEVLYELIPPAAETSYRYEARFTELVRKPEPKIAPLPAERLPEVAALYDSGIAQADERIGGFLDRLRSSGLEDRTAVVFTSDHGEGLGEHGSAGHGYLYEWNLLVPLVVALPGNRPEVRRVPAQVRLIDVMPTLLELAGLPCPPGIDGRSLLPLIENPDAPFPKEAYSAAAAGNRGVSVRVLNRWKYIYQRSPWQPFHGARELFDLRSDPGETTNLAKGDAGERMLRKSVEGHALRAGNHVAVRVGNAGPEPLRVRLGGPLAHAYQVKAFELPCECAVWENHETVLTVPPGISFPIYLEGPQETELQVSFAAGEATLSRTLPMGRLARPMRFVLLGGSWQTTSSPLPNGATGIEIERRGEAAGRPDDPAGSNEALREQLRGLGYIGR